MKQNESALVCLSGGQDSTTCLYWALKEFRHVETVCFSYGQKHALEVDVARRIAEKPVSIFLTRPVFAWTDYP